MADGRGPSPPPPPLMTQAVSSSSLLREGGARGGVTSPTRRAEARLPGTQRRDLWFTTGKKAETRFRNETPRENYPPPQQAPTAGVARTSRHLALNGREPRYKRLAGPQVTDKTKEHLPNAEVIGRFSDHRAAAAAQRAAVAETRETPLPTNHQTALRSKPPLCLRFYTHASRCVSASLDPNLHTPMTFSIGWRFRRRADIPDTKAVLRPHSLIGGHLGHWLAVKVA